MHQILPMKKLFLLLGFCPFASGYSQSPSASRWPSATTPASAGISALSSKPAGAKHASPGRSGPVAISPDLFGIFFEDISYAADGGLYGELVQNRSFEYGPADRKGWNPLSGWDYLTAGFGYGNLTVETGEPLNVNNPHYVVLTIEEPGREGIGLANGGYDGIALQAGSNYNFSSWIRQLSDAAVPMEIQLRGKNGVLLGKAAFTTRPGNWQKYTASISVSGREDSACLVVLAKGKGRLALDEISLFPDNTFKHRPNGMRADLAQAIADLHPKFMRFPGGCLVHGDGLGNMYRWKNTIGPVERRTGQKNIWGYHQSVGLGFYEYFQFCEDISAKPVPVVAAGVSCQNSGGTWSIGGTGQRAIPLDEMPSYIQDVLDLIEYANGPTTSIWGAKRAAAGHPAPFHLEYIGIGNEDKQTDEFRARFKMIYAAVHARHPEITIIGTAGPFPAGEDYDLGWRLADSLSIAVVDEHYYEKPEWFLSNGGRYDGYDRNKTKVYIGEYASQGNTLYNALAEAAYMTSLERNGDIVHMASYAPLLANVHHTSWNPDLIYFSNTSVLRTANYYVQQLFTMNEGDIYYPGVITAATDTGVAASCVMDSRTGDIILKVVHTGPGNARVTIDLARFGELIRPATRMLLTGAPEDKNTAIAPDRVAPIEVVMEINKKFVLDIPAYSLQVIRVKRGKNSVTGRAPNQGVPAPKPVYRDPVYDGAADPVVIWNPRVNKWWMFYTNRRANMTGLPGVSWVFGTPIGIAESADGADWKYAGTADFPDLPAECGGKDATLWAPDIVPGDDGKWHMYLSIQPGIAEKWGLPGFIAHLSSTDLRLWHYESRLSQLGTKCIDADMLKMPDGSWRMYYKAQAGYSHIDVTESKDLYTWSEPKEALRINGEGPIAFKWKGYYWLIIDTWNGQTVHRSTDGNTWVAQPGGPLLPDGEGTGKDDIPNALHANVVIGNDRAYMYYFTHPGRVGSDKNKDTYQQRRTSIQVVELTLSENGWITANRNKPTYVRLTPP